MEKEIMKKVLMLLLSAMLVLSMASVVSAADHQITQETLPKTDVDSSPTTEMVTSTVKLSVSERYTVNIPTEFIFDYNKELNAHTTSGNIKVDIYHLNHGTELNIYVDEDDVLSSGAGTYASSGTEWHLYKYDESTSSYDYASNVAYVMKVSTVSGHIEDPTTDTGLISVGASEPILSRDVTDFTNYLHMRVTGDPATDGAYQSKLTFTVKLE